MRLGILLGFERSLGALVEIAREGEAAGFGSMYTVEAGRNALAAASAVIGATERVRVGTYVVNAYLRDPWLAGLAARDLDEVSGGRFALGVGTGNVHLNRSTLGIDSSKPMAKMRDYLQIVRAVVAGRAGERVSYEGKVHSVTWRASWDPVRPSVPVYLSASGPNMVRLAGEVSDGVGVGIMSSAAFMRDIVRPNARAAAQAVGRDPDALAFPMAAIFSVNRDPELARNSARAAICGLFHPVPHPYYESQLRQLGFDEFADRAVELMPAGRISDAMALVPDDVVDTMTITGTPQQCADRVRDYDGLADEIIAFRVAQRVEPAGMAAYEGLLEVASLLA